MELRTLGKTGLEVSRVGFGGIPIQTVSEQQAVEAVRRCYDLGVNFFDTARAYTNSEERIGKALDGVRNEVVLATKSISRTREGVLRDFEASLKELRTDYIDVYQLHNVTYEHEWEQISALGGALEAVQELLEEGRILHIGVTGHHASLLATVIRTDLFETAMIPYNFMTLEPERELFPLCSRMGVGTIVMKPLGGGSFSSPEAALKYVLSSEDVDLVIPGVSSVDEVDANLLVASSQHALTAEERSEIEGDRERLGDSFCRNCNYCQPCPQGIPISFALRAESQFLRRQGWSERLGHRINDAVEKTESCVECGACETRCPYNLPIMRLLKEKSDSLIKVLEAHTLEEGGSAREEAVSCTR